LYSKGISENVEEFSVEVLKREASEGNCHEGRLGSGVGRGFVSF
jgi:hypothetical protein